MLINFLYLFFAAFLGVAFGWLTEHTSNAIDRWNHRRRRVERNLRIAVHKARIFFTRLDARYKARIAR